MEHLLQHLRQGCKELVNPSLEPAKKAPISDDLLRHTEVDVRFTVASVITEIIRITAPDVPYREEQMKDYFLLVDTAFKDLPSISGRANSKVVLVLQTISHCQICILTLDYELHDMVHETFHLFLNGIRPDHSESVS
ncbi:sister chromatid cohesion protein PDS5 homolog E-like isoform X2 [Primulina huaijiensis]